MSYPLEKKISSEQWQSFFNLPEGEEVTIANVFSHNRSCTFTQKDGMVYLWYLDYEEKPVVFTCNRQGHVTWAKNVEKIFPLSFMEHLL